MLQTTKIAKDLVGVTFDSKELLIRKSGRKYFGTEEAIVTLEKDRIIVNKTIADKYGLLIDIKE